MKIDYALIDCLEILREAYRTACPEGPPRTPERPASIAPTRWIAQAWLQAVEGKPASSATEQRRLRTFGIALCDAEATPPADDAKAQKLFAHREKLIEATEKLLRSSPKASRGDWVRWEEVEHWRKTLPAMNELRAWRLFERLGRKVVVPELATRRFLWRLGLVEAAPDSKQSFAACAAQLEALAQQTSLPAPLFTAMLQFHTGGLASRGGHCGARPRCEECVFKKSCTWARFHPAMNEPETDPGLSPAALEPVERRLAQGRSDELEAVELLALLLRSGGTMPAHEALPLADRLLRQTGGLDGLSRLSLEELGNIEAMTPKRAMLMKAALELGLRAATPRLAPGDGVSCSEDIWRAYRTRFRHLPQEHFVTLLFDTKSRVIGEQIVSRGGLASSNAHPREVFREAIRRAAASVILLHNHPSGDPTPSPEDHEITDRLCQAARILGIRVLDHIILGTDHYFSFRDDVWE